MEEHQDLEQIKKHDIQPETEAHYAEMGIDIYCLDTLGMIFLNTLHRNGHFEQDPEHFKDPIEGTLVSVDVYLQMAKDRTARKHNE